VAFLALTVSQYSDRLFVLRFRNELEDIPIFAALGLAGHIGLEINAMMARRPFRKTTFDFVRGLAIETP
jgi:hypothetical protein